MDGARDNFRRFGRQFSHGQGGFPQTSMIAWEVIQRVNIVESPEGELNGPHGADNGLRDRGRLHCPITTIRGLCVGF